jgi:large subunit ribosomal protein L7Ae
VQKKILKKKNNNKKNNKKKAPKKNQKKSTTNDKNKIKKKKVDRRAIYKNVIQATPKVYAVGRDLLPKRKINLGRYVKWPKYIRIQRSRAILKKRLRIPPAINHFNYTANKNLARSVLNLLHRHAPESLAARKKRLQKVAADKLAGKKVDVETRPNYIARGMDKVVRAIEKKQAQLVVIAHNVDPIELVIYLPALCVKMGVPYVIIKGMERLGAVVGAKKCTTLALVSYKKEEKKTVEELLETIRNSYNKQYSTLSVQWGGLIKSKKAQQKIKKQTQKV